MTACLDENVALMLIDGRLRKSSRGAVERHLMRCDGCRELVAELLRVDDAIYINSTPSATSSSFASGRPSDFSASARQPSRPS
jgi:anti-sigma factor RsiW